MKFLSKTYILLLIILAAATVSNAQDRAAKRAAEHQAVIDLMNRTLPKYPVVKSTSEKDVKKHIQMRMDKSSALKERRKSFLMNGNKIRVGLTNYGGIGMGYGGIREVTELVWRESPYIFQFGPLVGASVPHPTIPGKRLHIVSDGLNDWPQYNLPEVSSKGDTLWQWQPLPGYSDPDQEDMASNPGEDANRDGKPDSWPREWYNSTLGQYVWPGYLKQGVNNADLEVFWAMDDRENAEFPYYPFDQDHSRRGLGIQVDGRAFQWSNSLAENAIFFVYTITNVSDHDLDTVFFGVYGDPDVGNAADNKDDIGFFVPPYSTDSVNVDHIPVYARSLVYFWDKDMTGAGDKRLGYLGCKFLESPGNAEDSIDNDGDGLLNERQNDGRDNDMDWNAETDDVGVDGIPLTFDEGEGDGSPTSGRRLGDGSPDPLAPGEPNYEYTDLDEVDQIGLTSFSSWIWRSGGAVNNDELMWTRSVPRKFSAIPNENDIVFIYGSGYISLKKGESKRISMALLFGQDLNDLLTSAETVQDIYNKNYNFFKPPDIPKVTAVPGDKKVTLYWDNRAENSQDPITGKDFEGYVIYRSTDPSFNDVLTITDGKGARFLSEPLKDTRGYDAKWDVAKIDEPYVDRNNNGRWDTNEPFTDINMDAKWSAGIDDPWKGYHPVAYQGRGIKYYLGDNTGLVHSFVDSNNVVNGQTYYYAVVAYDHGDSLGIPPSETTKKIISDPVTGQLRFDDNTVMAIPGPRSNDYSTPVLNGGNVVHSEGTSNAVVNFRLLNDLDVKDNTYMLTFSDSLQLDNRKILAKNYSVFNSTPVTETVSLFGTKFTSLTQENIVIDDLFQVSDASGKIYSNNTDFVVNTERGSIRRSDNSTMPDNSQFKVVYRYYPIKGSRLLDGRDGNPVFDGISLTMKDYSIVDFNKDRTKWSNTNTNLAVTGRLYNQGRIRRYPADYEITFASSHVDSAVKVVGGKLIKIPVTYSVKDITSGVPKPILTYLNEAGIQDSVWTPGDEIVFFIPNAKGKMTDTLSWGITIKKPDTADSTFVPVPPTDGAKLFISTDRPFTKNDVYTLKTEAGRADKSKAKSGLDNIYVVPNPYTGYSVLEPANSLPGKNRGERRIYFENLPAACTIRIYTLSGEPVKTIEHNSGFANGREYWNLLNRDGFSVAYGLYVAHIDAPGIGEKIIKFALIK